MESKNKDILFRKLMDVLKKDMSEETVEAIRDFIKSYYHGVERINKMMELEDILGGNF